MIASSTVAGRSNTIFPGCCTAPETTTGRALLSTVILKLGLIEAGQFALQLSGRLSRSMNLTDQRQAKGSVSPNLLGLVEFGCARKCYFNDVSPGQKARRFRHQFRLTCRLSLATNAKQENESKDTAPIVHCSARAFPNFFYKILNHFCIRLMSLRIIVAAVQHVPLSRAFSQNGGFPRKCRSRVAGGDSCRGETGVSFPGKYPALVFLRAKEQLSSRLTPLARKIKRRRWLERLRHI
jgi:hypothetical protein